MFDCVEKKSLLKDIKYDYDIKTSQNIISSEKEKFSEDNYELSNNGICPKYCSQCKNGENQTIECIEWTEKKNDDDHGEDEDNPTPYPYRSDEEEDDDDDDDKKILYIMIGCICFVIIVIIIIVLIKFYYKKNINLANEVNKISFEQPREDYYQGFPQ